MVLSGHHDVGHAGGLGRRHPGIGIEAGWVEGSVEPIVGFDRHFLVSALATPRPEDFGRHLADRPQWLNMPKRRSFQALIASGGGFGQLWSGNLAMFWAWTYFQ